MQSKYTKDKNDPSCLNVHSTVCKGRKTSKVDHVRPILKRPVFKWTAVITTITVLSAIIVVPTVLEFTKHGK